MFLLTEFHYIYIYIYLSNISSNIKTTQVAWNTYDSKKNTADTFSQEEQETWNSEKKTSSFSQEGDAKK